MPKNESAMPEETIWIITAEDTPVTPDTTTSKEIPTITTTKIAPLEVPTEIKKSLLTDNETSDEKETIKENTTKKEDPAIAPVAESTLLSSVGIIDKLQEEKEHLDSLTTETPTQQ